LSLCNSCYKENFNLAELNVIKQGTPYVKKMTNIQIICEAMNVQGHVYKTMLSEVHKLLRLYLTVPISSATSERTFSALKHALTYLRSSMSQKSHNNCV